MSKQTASFYFTETWKNCRNAYAKSRGGLCEMCLEKGIYSPGVIVHHKVHITPMNMKDPNITLNWDNLLLVCRACHDKLHGSQKRYDVDPLGRVTPRE